MSANMAPLKCKAHVLQELIVKRLKECNVISIKEEYNIGKLLSEVYGERDGTYQPGIFTVTIEFQPKDIKVPIVRNPEYVIE